MRRHALALGLALGGLAVPASALADTIGLRPLGADYESARTIPVHRWVLELGGLQQTFDPSVLGALQGTDLATAQSTLATLQTLPAWPQLRGLYAWSDDSDIVVEAGQVVGGGYRRHFLRAEAPWGGEYLQALFQVGGGLNLTSWMPLGPASMPRPMGYLRVPALYETGPFTFNLSGGGYYMFNNQPIVDVNIGAELRPFDGFSLGANTHLRMDAKNMTPMAGTWSFGGGARYQFGDHLTFQIEAIKDAGPPTGGASPIVEFPYTGLQGSATYFY